MDVVTWILIWLMFCQITCSDKIEMEDYLKAIEVSETEWNHAVDVDLEFLNKVHGETN